MCHYQFNYYTNFLRLHITHARYTCLLYWIINFNAINTTITYLGQNYIIKTNITEYSIFSRNTFKIVSIFHILIKILCDLN